MGAESVMEIQVFHLSDIDGSLGPELGPDELADVVVTVLDVHLQAEEDVGDPGQRLLVVQDEVLAVGLEVLDHVLLGQVEHLEGLAETQQGQEPREQGGSLGRT